MKLDKLHSFAATIVRAIDPELTVDQSDENSYEYADMLVRLNLRDDEDFGFMRHLREVHLCVFADDYSPMLWTILHEVGHAQTEDDFGEDEYAEGLNTKMALACVPPAELRKNVVLQDRYFDTVEEWLATEWAIDYVREHNARCKRWSRILESRR